MDYMWFASLAPSCWLLEGLNCHLQTDRQTASLRGASGECAGKGLQTEFCRTVSSSAVRSALHSTALLFTLFQNWVKRKEATGHPVHSVLPETHCPSEFPAQPVGQSVSTRPPTFLFLLSSSLWVDTFKFLSVFRSKGVALSSVGRALAQHV